MLNKPRTLSTVRSSLVLLLLTPVLSCSWILDDHLNPRFCAAHPDDAECRQHDPDADTRCMANEQCQAPTGICELPQGVCVQCTPDSHAACSGQTPICTTDNTCHGCVAHSDCSSNACLPDGACGDDTNVAYVDPTGSDNALCTKAMPCTKVSKALATARPYVKFQGTTDDSASINDQKVTLLADPGAKLTMSKNGLLIEIKGTSEVAIYDLEITGASGPGGVGISLPIGNTPKLEIHRAKITNNSAGGISSNGGTLTISQSTFSGNTGGGISTTGGTLSITQSAIFSNDAGGVNMLTNGVVAVTNSFFYKNGNTSSVSAGALLLKPMGASKVEFNTIVDNLANTNSSSAGGVVCDQSGFTAPSNIIFRNTGGAGGNAQTFGNCAYGNSIAMAGLSPVDNSLGFVSPNAPPFDYHLGAASPSTVVDAAGACTGVDFDGDTRPIGAACDLGADERK